MGNGTSQAAGVAKPNNEVAKGSEPADAPVGHKNLLFKPNLQNAVGQENSAEQLINDPRGPRGLPGTLKMLLFVFTTVCVASGVHLNNELSSSRYEITKLQYQIKYSNNEILELKASLANQKEYFEKSSKTSEAKAQTLQSELEMLKTDIETLKITQCQCEKSQSGESFGIWNSISSLNLISSDSESPFEEPHHETFTTIIESVNSQIHFAESLRTLQGTFPSQTDDTWAQITSAVQSTMSDEQPPRPSSLLILFPQQSAMNLDFPICFAQKLARSINEAFNVQSYQNVASLQPKKIDAHYFTRMLSLTAVHNDLKSYLSRDGGQAVIIQNLDQIQNEDQLMVLHAFCDNSDYMAFDTRANFIATLSVPDIILNGGGENPALDWTHRNGGKISRSVLNSAWKRVTSDDKRGAVISRVAGNVILLNEGDTCE